MSRTSGLETKGRHETIDLAQGRCSWYGSLHKAGHRKDEVPYRFEEVADDQEHNETASR